MGRKRFSPEQITKKFREADIIESKGLTQVEVAKSGARHCSTSTKNGALFAH
jgi:hypothetical protein